MFGHKFNQIKRRSEDGERPFWISYADLMTALMVLFLVIMSISIYSLVAQDESREAEIKNICTDLQNSSSKFKDVKVECEKNKHTIYFGDRALFKKSSDKFLIPNWRAILIN